MGLLLGGSVLTLCELVDLVAFKLWETWLKNRKEYRKRSLEKKRRSIAASEAAHKIPWLTEQEQAASRTPWLAEEQV